MQKHLNLLCFDFGASSGRAILGVFDGEKIELTDLHRFSNDPVKLNDRLVWDVQRFLYEMKQALTKAAKTGLKIDAIGIDTWGVDYGLIGVDGNLVGIPVHYRDERTVGLIEEAAKIMPKQQIFERTGLAFLELNTLYQLLAMIREDDPQLKIADKLLMMPDLLSYFLTGEMATEYTIASTSQLIDPGTRDWSDEILDAFGIPRHLMTKIQQPGEVRGVLLKEIADEVGLDQVPVIAVASHDTASAVAAVPASTENFAFLSSGTWSLLGTEIKAPMRDVKLMDANYSNEGGLCGTTRLLKNIMGLWIISECQREWDRREDAVDIVELVRRAEAAEPFFAVLNVDDPSFNLPGDMPARVQQYCERTGQRVPKGRGQISRVVYESLALKYRWGVERLEQDLLGHALDAFHIVGGGSKNKLLNQFTADALGKTVYAGPSEGTAIGNLLVQAMGLGAIEDLAALRRVVRRSFPVEQYQPCADRAGWDKGYQTLLGLL
ncbi:rhamnulokinase [Eubacteriales bacterium OttesenSCG-928-N13]|nr:rhamnulokinase [Eubacteriales bacterium OttesenSCG-928-N13]